MRSKWYITICRIIFNGIVRSNVNPQSYLGLLLRFRLCKLAARLTGFQSRDSRREMLRCGPELVVCQGGRTYTDRLRIPWHVTYKSTGHHVFSTLYCICIFVQVDVDDSCIFITLAQEGAAVEHRGRVERQMISCP